MWDNRKDLIGAIFKLIVFGLALWIAGVSVVGAFNPELQSGIFRRLMRSVPWAGYAHVLAGSMALVLGGLQMSSYIRRKSMPLHKLMGNAYVVCVLLGTVGAIATLLESTTGWAAKSGFWLLAFAWPATTLAGYPWRGKFDVKWHGRLMIYSYAMTCAAITLRLYLGLLMVSGVSYLWAYPIAAWGGGIGNLILASLAMRIAGIDRESRPLKVS